MRLLNKITTLLIFLSLIAFISCSAEDKTGGVGNDGGDDNGGGADSVPTFTGDPATDLPNGYYSGTISHKSHNIYEFSVDGANKEELEQEITNDMTFYLKITNNILQCSEGTDFDIDYLPERQVLKYGSEYSVTTSGEYNNVQGSKKGVETIRFTISGDNISFTFILGRSLDMKEKDEAGNIIRTSKYSYDATYEGTLTKYKYIPTPLVH